jgi:CelD/BcsL family acetyltransferase involved in cellulose biosynthesis
VPDVEYVPSLDHVGPEDWHRLAKRAGHIYATREWLRTWWRHYGKARRQLIGLARSEGELVAIVPLYVWRRHGLPVLRFVGHGPSDQLGPICAPMSEPATAAAVAEAIAAVPLRRFVLLAEQLPGDQDFGALTRARPLYRDSSPVLHMGRAGWDAFLKERGRNFRQQVRRFPRKVAEVGPVSYRLASDPDHLQRDLDLLFELHRKRWAGSATAFLQARAFHAEFAQHALSHGWLRLWFLEVGGVPVAAHYGFRYAAAETAYQGGRDPALRSQPLGFVLLIHTVRDALDDGIREFRLGRGGAAYKERFATDDPGVETFALPCGRAAQLALLAALAVRDRSLGLRRILDRM